MSIQIGGIDPVKAIIDLELRVGILEKLLQEANKRGLHLTQIDLDSARDQAVSDLQKKYPQLGIEAKHG